MEAIERIAKAAYEEMVRSYSTRHALSDLDPHASAWEGQTRACQADWIASLRAALKEAAHDDLVEACKLALADSESQPFHESRGNADRALTAIRAALAKAEGRA